jgi:hypothetical protein
MSYLSINKFTSNVALDYTNQYDYYMLDATGGNITVTLFNNSGTDGVVYRFNRSDSSGNSVTLTCYSGQTYWDTTTSKTLASNAQLHIVSYGGVWYLS